MHLFPEYQDIFSQLDTETIVLTPNQRLSRLIQSQYVLWCQRDSSNVWPSLICQSWNSWLMYQWEVLQVSGGLEVAQAALMTPAQERIAWEQSIQGEVVERLLAGESMAELSAQAWKFLRQWQKPLEDLSSDIEETSHFSVWTKNYIEICNDKKLIDSTGTKVYVAEAFFAKILCAPKHILCIGFDELSPLDNSIVSALKYCGTQLSFVDVILESHCSRVVLSDAQVEITTMARWAAKLIESKENISIGLVVPDLANMRGQVERIFTDVFEPQYKFPDQPRHAPAFNISAAQPLAQTPLISVALSALKLNKKEIDSETLSKILTSRFISVRIESRARTKLLRGIQKQYINISASALTAAVNSYVDSELEQFKKNLKVFHKIMQPFRFKKLKCSRWVELFAEQLIALGWPGDNLLDTLEFQQLNHWPVLLKDVARLDSVLTEVDLSRALAELSKAAYIPFHAQTKDSPVQILGLLEAAGQQFDYLWVMGLDHRTWPEACSPNPLISPAQQRVWSMPRSSTEKELSVAQHLTNRLLSSAYQVIFSTPAMEGDQPLQPSPLIANLPLIEKAEIDQCKEVNYIKLLRGQVTHTQEDGMGARVEDVSRIRGGAQILKNQAACPFRAFAKHRLFASNPEYVRPGISAITRGNLMHKSLEIIWNRLLTQRNLLALDSDEIESLTHDAIKDAWLSIREAKQLGAIMKGVESQRTQKLILQWLNLEKLRMPFRVKYLETAQQFSVGNMPLTIRYDRVDELDSTGELMVLDYKTGETNIKSWAGERPDDPQVPLYCLSLQTLSAVAAVLAQINIKQVAAKGLSIYPDLMPGINTPEDMKNIDLPNRWKDIHQYWEKNLEGLAGEFISGDARVKPKYVNQTCVFCDLKKLCRVDFDEVSES